MKVTILAGGTLRDKALKSLMAPYEKRLRWTVKWVEIPEQKSHKFKDYLPPDAFTIALDERGESLSSEAFSTLIEKKQLSGISHLCFLIGNAEGFPEALSPLIHHKISFGRATWPHMIVRLLLIEQLYRAQQILSGHPYHKD